MQSIYANYFIDDARSFIELLQYCQVNNIEGHRVKECVNKLARQFPDNVSTAHVMALLGNQPCEVILSDQQPDSIALQSLENLLQLDAMMNYN